VFPKIVNFLFWLLFGPKKPRKSQFNFEPKRYKMVSLSAKRSVFGLGRKKLRFFTILEEIFYYIVVFSLLHRELCSGAVCAIPTSLVGGGHGLLLYGWLGTG